LIGHRLHYRLATSLVIAASLLLLAGCQGLAAGSNSTGNVGVRNGNLSFGKVPIGASKAVSDTLTNNTSSEITISSIQGLASGFQVTGITLPLVLAAGQTAQFGVEFQPTDPGTPAITIAFAGANGRPYVSLSATGNAVTIGRLLPNPSPVAFANTQVGANQTSTVALTNNGGTDLTITGATLSGVGFAMSNLALPITLHAGATASATITFAPTGSGDFTGSATFATNAAQQQSNVKISIHGHGVGPGTLALNPSSIAFGSVQVGGSSSQSEALTNTGGSPVTVSQATASGTGFSISGLTLPVTLNSGQSTSFTVVFSPTASGAMSGSVNITSNGANPNLSIPLSGTGVAAGSLAANPSSLAFGSVQVGSNSSLSETLSNSGGTPITISQASATGTGFSISGLALPVTLNGGQSTSFKVLFAPTGTGATSGSVNITSNGANPNLSITLSGTGVAAGSLGANPSSLAFGNVQVGSSSSQSETLTNTGGTAVTISQATATGTGFSISGLALPVTLNGGQSTSFKVLFAPTAGGAVSGNVNITSNGADPNLSIPLSGTGVAAAGTLAANPASLAFGSVQVGNSTNLSETLTNTGVSAVTITQANSPGSGFSISGLSLPLTLNANQSVTFTATFAPTAAGAASATLSVVSNASNSPLNIALSGTGTAAGSLAVSPTSLSFGNVTVGSSSVLNGNLTASGASVTVTSAGINNGEFAISGISLPVTLAVGQSASFKVTFTPQASGAASASLTFSSNAGNSPTVQTMTGTGVAAIQHTVDLTWNASNNAVGYNVYRGNVSGGPYSMINTSLDGSTAYADNTVSSGQTYYYVATAVDGGGNESAYSTETQAVVPNP
jgi:hypothetical protein